MGITLILISILFSLSIIFEYSNKYTQKVFNISISILILFIYTFNKWSNDYGNYSGLLFTSPEKNVESGYVILVKIVRYFNFSFNTILFIVAIILLLCIKKIKNNTGVLILYIIYPLVLDLNQIRNSLMIFFIIFSLNYFIENKKIKGSIFYLIGLSFQSLGWIYTPFFIFFRKVKMSRLYNYTIIVYTLNFFVCVYLYKALIIIQSKISYNRIISKLLYYVRPMSYSTLILWTGLFLIDIYLIEKLFKYENKDSNALSLYYKFILYCGSLIPIFTVVRELNRVYRNTFLIKYILIFFLIEKSKKNKVQFFLILFLEATILLTLLYLRGLMIDKTIFSFFYFD